MQRVALLIFVLLVSGICGMMLVFTQTDAIAQTAPSLTPMPYRDIEIEVLTETESDGLFVIGEIFALRNHEGFQIWTHQSDFWQPGDFFDARSLDVEIVFDNTQVVEPFVFWRSSAIQDIYDDNDKSIGRFLAADMNIGVSTSRLDLGEHVMVVRVQTPHGTVFSQGWEFVILERDTPRFDIPPEIAPTAECLDQIPEPTPVFLISLAAQPTFLDRFSPIGSREGLCLTLDDEPLVPPELADNPFRSSVWDEITITVDDMLLNDDQIGIQSSDTPGVLFLCVDTDFLAAGVHLAELRVAVNGEQYAYQWVFTIETKKETGQP